MTEPECRIYVDPDIGAVRELHRDLFTDSFQLLSIRDQLDRQAERMVQAHQEGNDAVAVHVTCWHPHWVGHKADQIMSKDFSLEDARETIAREYGFENWFDAERRGENPPSPEFESAVDALLAGRVGRLGELLASNPSLTSQRSDYGHGSSLLHYVGCNGVETHRQVVPSNLAKVAQLLIDAGSDVNAKAEMYGGGSTTIALLITSGFPAEAGVTDEVVKVLIDAGAVTDQS